MAGRDRESNMDMIRHQTNSVAKQPHVSARQIE